MTRKSKAQYQADLDATIGPNGTGGITGVIANDRYEDLKDSAMWWDEGPVPAWYVGLATFTPVLSDIVASVDDPGGTPVNGKLTLGAIFDLFRTTGGASAAFIGSGQFADARISLSSVKQHEAALSIAGSQIPGFSDVLKANETGNLTAGYTSAALDLGTITGGTVTLALTTRNNQRLTNAGAFTLAPPAIGEGTMLLKITNGAGAGVISTEGFTTRLGSGFTTTQGHVFWCSIAVNGGESLLNVLADSRNL